MTNAELVVLTLLIEGQSYGYEIEQLIERRGMREWTEIGFSSIYYLLNKLEKNGLVESEIESHPGKGPDRKVFRLTASGQQAVDKELLLALSIPKKHFPTIQLGLANLPSLQQEAAIDALRRYSEELGERKAELEVKREMQRPLPAFVEAMFDYSVTMMEAERSWVTAFTDRWEASDEQAGF